MNKRVVITIFFASVLILIWLIAGSKPKNGLLAPGYSETLGEKIPDPTPEAPVAPKTFEFGPATDLEAELEKVNPEVLDSDFE